MFRLREEGARQGQLPRAEEEARESDRGRPGDGQEASSVVCAARSASPTGAESWRLYCYQEADQAA